MENKTTTNDLTRVLSGLWEYTVCDASETSDGLVVEVIATRLDAPCPVCGTLSDRVKSYRISTVVDSSCFGRRCRLLVRRRAFRCVNAGCERKSFTEATSEVPRRARVTTRCRVQMGVAGRDCSTASVAAEFAVSWPTACKAIKAQAEQVIAQRPKTPPRRLGIDETRFWWKVPWLTGLVDLDTGELVEVIEGRTSKTVTDWLETLSDNDQQQIKVVVCDPHAGYRHAITTSLEQATVVVDRFHVAMLANKAVTDVRRRRIWEQQDRRGRKIDPGWRARKDLCRRVENVTDNGWSRIIAAMQADTGTDSIEGDLAWTWAAKEHLTTIYDSSLNRAHAHRQLLWWYSYVADHPVPELVRLATTISKWENEFLAYFDTRATNGVTEGLNRIIKHVKRLGFGYQNTDNYRLKILYRCQPLQPLQSTPPATTDPTAALSL
ncbi:MAG: ISL3 family transposase [Acidimicrobiales bacterium]|nr:ISL3 family transposase [Acidimicrobiales bacterium]